LPYFDQEWGMSWGMWNTCVAPSPQRFSRRLLALPFVFDPAPERHRPHAPASLRGLGPDLLPLPLLVGVTPCLRDAVPGLIVQRPLVRLGIFVHVGRLAPDAVPAATLDGGDAGDALQGVEQVGQVRGSMGWSGASHFARRMYARRASVTDEPAGAVRRASARGRGGVDRARSRRERIARADAGRFPAAFPEVRLDPVVSDQPTEIVPAGFDAGVTLGEMAEQDMIAVPRVDGPFTAALP
jgi:hypothetical protein